MSYPSSHISSRDKSLIVGAFDSVFTAHFLLHRAALGHLSTLHQEGSAGLAGGQDGKAAGGGGMGKGWGGGGVES